MGDGGEGGVCMRFEGGGLLEHGTHRGGGGKEGKEETGLPN